MMTLTFGSLFAGIGGFDLGLERAGMACKWQVEIDPFCTKVLTKHWPNVPKFGDIRNVGKHNLESVDLICGGFPCQPHSLAGKRRGKDDDRDLWPEYRRVIIELRPTWIIGENVPGIVGTILDTVLSDLDNLGYSAQAISIPAAALDAPHIRERVFILGHANSSQWRAKPQRWNDGNGDDAGWQEAPGRFEVSSQNDRNGILAHPAKLRCKSNGKLADGERVGQKQEGPYPTKGYWWATEPAIRRVANGIPNRVDRLRGLGNAVVPQIPELLGRMILEVEGLTQ